MQAAAARTSLVTHLLVDDLREDRQVASGKGVRASHLATWTTFRIRAAVVCLEFTRTHFGSRGVAAFIDGNGSEDLSVLRTSVLQNKWP